MKQALHIHFRAGHLDTEIEVVCLTAKEAAVRVKPCVPVLPTAAAEESAVPAMPRIAYYLLPLQTYEAALTLNLLAWHGCMLLVWYVWCCMLLYVALCCGCRMVLYVVDAVCCCMLLHVVGAVYCRQLYVAVAVGAGSCRTMLHLFGVDC